MFKRLVFTFLFASFPSWGYAAPLPPPPPSSDVTVTPTAKSEATLSEDDKAFLRQPITFDDPAMTMEKWLPLFTKRLKINLAAGDLDWAKSVDLPSQTQPLRDLLDAIGEKCGFLWSYQKGILALRSRPASIKDALSGGVTPEMMDYLGLSTKEQMEQLQESLKNVLGNLTPEQKAVWDKNGALLVSALTSEQQRQTYLLMAGISFGGFLNTMNGIMNQRDMKVSLGHMPKEATPTLRLKSQLAPNHNQEVFVGGPLIETTIPRDYSELPE